VKNKAKKSKKLSPPHFSDEQLCAIVAQIIIIGHQYMELLNTISGIGNTKQTRRRGTTVGNEAKDKSK
jgi:hypothetical protein